jgi:hypothetical protein
MRENYHCVLSSDYKSSKILIPVKTDMESNAMIQLDASGLPLDINDSLENKNYVYNLNKYSLMIAQELLTNNIKRIELLNNEYDDIVDMTYYDTFEDIIIIDGQQYESIVNPTERIKATVNYIYNKSDKYVDKLNNMYDVVNPRDNTGYNELSTFTIDYESMPKSWSEVIGYKFEYIKHKHTSQNIFNIMSKALTSLNPDNVVSIESLRGILSEYVEKMELDYEKHKNQSDGHLYIEPLYMRSPKQLWIDFQIVKSGGNINLNNIINTLNDLVEYMYSSEYYMTCLDVILIGIIFNVNIYILEKNFGQHSVHKIRNFGIKLANTDKCILLYEPEPHQYLMVVDSQHSPKSMVHSFQTFPQSLKTLINNLHINQQTYATGNTLKLSDIGSFLNVLDIEAIRYSVVNVVDTTAKTPIKRKVMRKLERRFHNTPSNTPRRTPAALKITPKNLTPNVEMTPTENQQQKTPAKSPVKSHKKSPKKVTTEDVINDEDRVNEDVADEDEVDNVDEVDEDEVDEETK